MSATEILREDVKELVDHAGDKALRMVKVILEKQQGEEDDDDIADEQWEDMPEELQVLLTEAIKQCEEGKVIPHEQVIEKYSKWFQK